MALDNSLGIFKLIPTELRLAILAECDRATLAALCRTSFALLELALPELYQTYEIVVKTQNVLDLITKVTATLVSSSTIHRR